MLKCSIAIAALMLSAPFAFAQGAGDTGKNVGGTGMSSSGPRSSGPSSSGLKSGGVPHDRSGGSSGASEGASGSDSSASDFAPGQKKGSGSAKENAPGQMKSEGAARDYAPGHQKDSSDKSNQRSETKSKDLDRDRADRGERNSDRDATNDRDRNSNEARTHERGGASTGTSEGTEGRSGGGRGSIASVTTEQKTRIRSVFTRHHVEPARNLNVTVNVGVRIPHSVHLYPVPTEVIEIVPAYRDYEYIMLDDDRIAIIDPDTFEVVDVIVLA